MTAIGNNDGFVFKLDSTGTAVFAKNFGTTSAEQANAIAVDSTTGDIYVGGAVGAANPIVAGKYVLMT